MRRNNEQYYKNKTLALLNDCVDYCFQNYQITKYESIILEDYLEKLEDILKEFLD